MKKNVTDQTQKIRNFCHEDMNIQGVIVKESYERISICIGDLLLHN